MRASASLALLCLLATPAHADKRRAKADPRVTPVDDEPTSHTASASDAAPPPSDRRTPADVGELRAATVVAPSAQRVDTGAAATREHDVAPPVTSAATTPDVDLSAELAARQMRREARRHQRAFDACTAAAQRRHPGAAGAVTLVFEIADRKLASVVVTDDSVHDPALAACLTAAARSLSFSLGSARFSWSIAVAPSAAR
jgi:hypothetical protein